MAGINLGAGAPEQPGPQREARHRAEWGWDCDRQAPPPGPTPRRFAKAGMGLVVRVGTLRVGLRRRGYGGERLALPPPAADGPDPPPDGIAEPVGAPTAPAGQRGAGVVHLEVVAGEPARRDVALEPLAEAGEDAARNHADDLALPGLIPAALDQSSVEQPGRADVVGDVLDLGRLALAFGG